MAWRGFAFAYRLGMRTHIMNCPGAVGWQKSASEHFSASFSYAVRAAWSHCIKPGKSSRINSPLHFSETIPASIALDPGRIVHLHITVDLPRCWPLEATALHC